MNKSLWFRVATDPPVHVGLYEVRRMFHAWNEDGHAMLYWDGNIFPNTNPWCSEWRGVVHDNV